MGVDVITQRRSLLRITLLTVVLILSAFFFFTLTGCSPVNNPSKQALLLKTDKAAIGVDPQTVEVKDGTISADIHFNYYEPTPGGFTNVRWSGSFNVPERRLYLKAIVRYDARRNSYLDMLEGTGQSFVAAGSLKDKIMQALIAYCNSRGLPMKTEPAPFLKLGYTYVGQPDDNGPPMLIFFDPASVKLATDHLEYSQLTVSYNLKGYAIHVMQINLPEKKVRILPGKVYEMSGKFLGEDSGRDWQHYPSSAFLVKIIDTIKKDAQARENKENL